MTDSKGVTFKPAGTATVTIGSDGIPTISSDEPISTTMKQILSYGIENIVDIRSYNIEHKDGKVFHHVVFNSGGTIELSMDLDGKNFSASANDMTSSVTGGNRILIREQNSK